MSDKSDSGPSGHRPTADDVRNVLDAEAAIKRKVDGFREELAESVAKEQARARRVEQRTNERLSRLHARCEHSMEAQAARMRAGARLPRIQPDESDRKRLAEAVSELAARLTGRANG